MAKRHNERDEAQADPTSSETTNEAPTDAKDDATGQQDGDQPAVTRRTFAKSLAAAAAIGGGTSLFGKASAASIDSYLEPDGEVTMPAGEYSWSGSGLDVGADAALLGEGNSGDVVWNLESGTMDGNVAGTLENVVVRGANKEAKAGINLSPGATVDGFVWPEGGQQSEDRAFYTPDGGDSRLTIRNAAWARMVNNGAYVDKPPVTMENCASINNNIAGVRVGHRDGTSSGKTTYVRNTLIAVTDDVLNDDTNSPNARGLRLRKPGNLVVENCWFVYFDVSGTADLVELHDGAAGSTVTIRDCVFYNDSNGSLVRDKSGGEMDVTIENCTVAGSGSREIEPDYSGNGITEADSVDVPLPSDITGYAAADDVEGFSATTAPWDGSSSQDTSSGHSLVMHASADNGSAIDVSFTVDGDIQYGADAESDTDIIVSNDDGTTTATSVSLSPDELDSYEYTGSVVDYAVPDGAQVDVSVDGTTTTFADLVVETDDSTTDDGSTSDSSTDDSTSTDSTTDADVVEVVARQSGPLNYEFDVEGDAELHETSDMVKSGNGDTVTANGDGTVTVSGFTGNDGYGDAYLVSGSILSFTWDDQDYDFDVIVNGETVDPTTFGETTDDSTSDGSTTDDSTTDDSTSDDSTTDDSSGTVETPHLITVDGQGGSDVTTYTFTVEGDVVRDDVLSAGGDTGTDWSQVEDFATDGKVIGLVGGGVDAYRFSGNLTEITVEGDADVSIDWNA